MEVLNMVLEGRKGKVMKPVQTEFTKTLWYSCRPQKGSRDTKGNGTARGREFLKEREGGRKTEYAFKKASIEK